MKVSNNRSDHDHTDAVAEHGDYLFRYALLRVGKRQIAEDLVQETFLSALKNIESFRGDGELRAWLRTILRNKITDLARSTQGKESDPIELFDDWGIWRDPTAKWFLWSESPFDVVERGAFFKVVRSCLSKLPEKQRIVIGMRAFDGLSTEEICKELSISPSNEWVITYRARLLLRECLERNWQR